MIVTPPSAWPEAERAFHLAYLADPVPFPRQPVVVSWATRTAPVGRLGPLLRMVTSAWRDGVVRSEGVEVTVTSVGVPDRSMTFPIAGPTPLRSNGASKGVLVGGLGTNAVACLEVDGQVLWPTANPVQRR